MPRWARDRVDLALVLRPSLRSLRSSLHRGLLFAFLPPYGSAPDLPGAETFPLGFTYVYTQINLTK